MKTVAIYNMKGGVGKTTTAINLSFLAAEAGQRVLLWDLDPQGASSFAFRIRPHVSGFGKRSLEDGHAFEMAIKQTDYDNLCLLPADFAYHKLDRLLHAFRNPERLVTSLLATIGHDFDLVFLDCPAGFSGLTEAIISAADLIIAPTIPTILSIRMVARLVRQAQRCNARSTPAAFLNMVDRRKSLHRRVSELASEHPEIFMSPQVPYASVVEQTAARRMPTAAFAAYEPATRAFAEICAGLQARLRPERNGLAERLWVEMRQGIESLIERLETTDGPLAPTNVRPVEDPTLDAHDPDIVHRFDTEERDVERYGQVLELRERPGGEFLVVARSMSNGAMDRERAEARIDRFWTVQILSGELCPLAALERRIGPPEPRAVGRIRTAVGGRALRRVDTSRPTADSLTIAALGVRQAS